jgi:hypothetical protein
MLEGFVALLEQLNKVTAKANASNAYPACIASGDGHF